MDGGLGERAEVPGGSAVVAAQRFAPVQPGQRAVQQRGAAYLAPCSEKAQRNAGYIPFATLVSPPSGCRAVPPTPLRPPPSQRAQHAEGASKITADAKAPLPFEN